MSALKRLFTGKKLDKKDVDYSPQRAMVRSPPPGKVTSKFDPNHEVWKPQFSSGDQTDESRLPFYNSGFAVCPKCGERNIWRFEEKAGVKPNGDTYGTESFICQTMSCGWTTTFMYDDGAATCSHFEARHWPRGIHKYPTSFMMMWADKHNLSQNFKHQIFSKKITGDRLLEMEATGSLAGQLGLGRKEAEKIKKALHDPRGATLTQSGK